MKIAYHDNALCLFGTTVALKKIALANKKFLNIEPIILYNGKHPANDNSIIESFKKTFNNQVFSYDIKNEIDLILKQNNCDYFFMIKSGKYDGIESKICKNLINAVGLCHINEINGDVFAMASKWLSSLTNYKIPFVPHIVELPHENRDLKNELNIPKDSFVVGRNGGKETFDIKFVHDAIKNVVDRRKNIWFIFQCTNKFIDHERVLFLPCSSDENYKIKFINTCDIMLHAREVGESFGISCGEFSIKNKPILTWFGSRERSHIDILGDRGIYYNDENDLTTILLNIEKKDIKNKDWNCYKDYSPELVVSKFKEVYLK